MKTEAEIWQRLKRETGRNVHWTRLETRVGAGVPDLNGAFLWPPQGHQSPIEIWVELKVCRTKAYKTAGLWRPAQIAWQTARSRVSPCVWNMVSHPETEVLRIYGGSRVADLWDEKGLNIEPDMVLRYRDPWSMFLDFAAARALDAIIPRTDSRAFDPIVTPGSTI